MLPSVIWIAVFSYANNCDAAHIARVARTWNQWLQGLWKTYLFRKNPLAYKVCAIEDPTNNGFKTCYRDMHVNVLSLEECNAILMQISQPYLKSASIRVPENVLRDVLVYERLRVGLGCLNALASCAHVHETLFNIDPTLYATSESKRDQYLSLTAERIQHDSHNRENYLLISDMYVRLHHKNTFIILKHGVARGYIECFLAAEKWPDKTDEDMLELCQIAESKCSVKHVSYIRIRTAKIWQHVQFSKFVDILTRTIAETDATDVHRVELFYHLGNGYEYRHQYVEAERWYDAGYEVLCEILKTLDRRNLGSAEFCLCQDVVHIRTLQGHYSDAWMKLRAIQADFTLDESQQDMLRENAAELHACEKHWADVLAIESNDPGVREFKILAHYELGEYQQAIDITPDTFTYRRTLRFLARCHIAVHNLERAREYLQQYEADDESMRAAVALEWANFYAAKSRECFGDAENRAKRVKPNDWCYGFSDMLKNF